MTDLAFSIGIAAYFFALLGVPDLAIIVGIAGLYAGLGELDR